MNTFKYSAILSLAIAFAPLASAQEVASSAAEQAAIVGSGLPFSLENLVAQDGGPLDGDKEKKGKTGDGKKKDGERKKKDGERKKKDGERKKKDGERKKKDGERKKKDGEKKRKKGERKKKDGERKKKKGIDG
ncbi:MAG: hypothetical protein P8R48_12120 [Planctomycetota bacterium]|nr:hypothetical protein [Planctomycetota bacterium]